MSMDGLALDMPTGFDPNSGVVQFGKENQVYVRFYRGSKRDNFASKENGVPIEKQVDYVEVRQFGEKDSTILEVEDHHKRRWPTHWANYSRGLEQAQDGTPLDVLFPRNPEIVGTLKANHIYTIQALAAIPDSNGAIPFIQDHKRRAKEFLSGLDGGKRFHQLESQLEASELKVMEQADLIKSLSERLTNLETKSKSKE